MGVARQLRPYPAMARMGSWRTQVVVVLLASGWWPATAQSLGDVARAERERRSKLPHHASVLSDEDLGRNKILEKTPRDADSALPASSSAADAVTREDVSLGDYARALRQRRAAEQASAQHAAAQPATESESAGANPEVLTPLSGVVAPDQKTMSLGDFTRQVRAERDAARLARTRSSPPQPAAQDSNDTRVAQPREANARPTPTTGVSPARSAKLRPGSSTTPSSQSRAVLEPGVLADGETKSIRVPRGSSLWKLAREHLGDGRLWTAFWKANPEIRDPNRIRAGQLLRLPVTGEQEYINSARIAGLPAGRAVSPAGTAGRLSPAAIDVHSVGHYRKSLFSRTLSR
ncbi:MAG: LysM peptidoglycan-binding domain-containing protein [Terriglobales bacterium]